MYILRAGDKMRPLFKEVIVASPVAQFQKNRYQMKDMDIIFPMIPFMSRDVSLGSGVATPRKKKTNRTESQTIQVKFEFSLSGTFLKIYKIAPPPVSD